MSELNTMTEPKKMTEEQVLIDLNDLTEAERGEMIKLGMLTDSGEISENKYPEVHTERPPVLKSPVRYGFQIHQFRTFHYEPM